jgi:polar amino acid transport system substrate-binding protein
MNNKTINKFSLISSLLISSLIHSTPLFAQSIRSIQDAGVIKLGYREDSFPFSYKNISGNAEGYSIEICNHVAETIKSQFNRPKMKVEYIPVTSENRFNTLSSGKVNILCEAVTETLSRRQKMSFSLPIFYSGMGVLVGKEAPEEFQKLLLSEDPKYKSRWQESYNQILEGKSLAVIAGSISERWLYNQLKHFDAKAKLVTYLDYKEGVQALSNGKIDALFGDHNILVKHVSGNNPSKKVKLLDKQYSFETIALAIQDNDKGFTIFIDRVLSRLYDSGELEKIHIKYFGELDKKTKILFSHIALPE